jgi:hypothetical protein
VGVGWEYYLADQCAFGRDWDNTLTPKSRSWQYHFQRCRSSPVVFGDDH